MTIVGDRFFQFEPQGVTGTVLLAESHLAIHTWPEYRYAAVDIFSCGEVLQPEVAANYLVEQFSAERTSVVEMQRGMFLNSATPIANKAAAGPKKPIDCMSLRTNVTLRPRLKRRSASCAATFVIANITSQGSRLA